ncbi:uncharacterized protein UV8b_07857 [Ustilaginoidea virens]|uniref:Uncharacterized protein n=1 Tax=Ustilaginoidea virens TaxID=1159556 RepID=A0A063C2D3_USTVR|nr:uncharacterized protein UV8b_07857 [Ustilaginoidea virens]QUC23616.1 hypothetical protein UV8b_07857 [Ustilaginoidea virens]GAO17549.1 hypothetical protein UVI_02003160 [Ustilaginoidea virens]
MAWEHLDITKPHLVYIILGGFTSLFMLCSSFIKERMYIGEATVATLCGVIFGPHAANLIDPNSWGNADIVTVEFSRIVLVVQCFAVGVELPKYYMEKHWKSVVFLLVPVMTFGWLVTSLLVWWMIPALDWLESLVVAACVTATDPVLASSVVGKGKFAKRVPKHLRDLLSAESGCNDGMAFPFIYLSLYLIQYQRSAREVSFHFIVYVVLYECIFGAVYGFLLGYVARHGIRFAESRDLIDRESFLVFYFVVALFCAGSGSILGLDDLLVGFAAGVGFSNDGWFGMKTEESHVSNVIDLLLNLTYFVYFGTIIPWEQYNDGVFGMVAWRLVVIAVFVLLFRRIPVMLALKPFIPDVKNWREALFAGHFGPIGVGAIFVAMLARAELEHSEPVPLGEIPPPDSPHYKLIYLVWPIVTFLVISSILIHGSSIAVFTLGKRINTLTLTMSYTAAPEDGPSWMNRLPRISSQSRSMAKTMSEASFDDLKEPPSLPAGTLAPPTGFLRRQRDEDGHGHHSRPGSRASSLVSKKRRHKKWDDGIGPGGPISQSAIFPNRSPQPETSTSPSPPTGEPDSTTLASDEPREKQDAEAEKQACQPTSRAPHVNVYDEGHRLVFENDDGDVIDIQPSPEEDQDTKPPGAQDEARADAARPGAERWGLGGLRRKVSEYYTSEMAKRKDKGKSERRHEPARAYQFGNAIIVEDEDGEVVKTYELPSSKSDNQGSHLVGTGLKYLGLGSRRHEDKDAAAAAEEGQAGPKASFRAGWAGFGQRGEAGRRKQAAQKQQQQQQQQQQQPPPPQKKKPDGVDDGDDQKIRFTIGGVGRRMTKDDFIREMQKLDAGTRNQVVDRSSASTAIKSVAKKEPPPDPQSTKTPQGQARAVAAAVRELHVGSDSSSNGQGSASGGKSSGSGSASPLRQPEQPAEPPRGRRDRSSSSDQEPAETAVERRRRLAALAGQAEGRLNNDDTGETPAERRRRQAALGIGSLAAEQDSDTEDEGMERVPPARRGIRFAEPQRKW